MDRVFIDEETGEDLIHYDIRDCTLDSTTVNNAETGEPEVSLAHHPTARSHLRRVPFQVTSPTTSASAGKHGEHAAGRRSTSAATRKRKFGRDNLTMNETNAFSVKNDRIPGYNETSSALV